MVRKTNLRLYPGIFMTCREYFTPICQLLSIARAILPFKRTPTQANQGVYLFYSSIAIVTIANIMPVSRF